MRLLAVATDIRARRTVPAASIWLIAEWLIGAGDDSRQAGWQELFYSLTVALKTCHFERIIALPRIPQVERLQSLSNKPRR